MTKVVYHSADFDGLFSGAAVYRFLKMADVQCDLVGWDFGDPPVRIGTGHDAVIVDLPPSCVSDTARIAWWIDHHASAMAVPEWKDIPGLRIDGVAACRLAWHFFDNELYEDYPERVPRHGQHFLDRSVREPKIVRLVGEYDVWDKRDDDAECVQFGLMSEGPWSPAALCSEFLETDSDWKVPLLVATGAAARKWQRAFALSVSESKRYCVTLEGLDYFTICSVHARNSMWFPNVPEWADGLCCVQVDGSENVAVSLYGAPGKEHHDHSLTAKKYGGGGHKAACGFRVTLSVATALGLLGPCS